MVRQTFLWCLVSSLLLWTFYFFKGECIIYIIRREWFTHQKTYSSSTLWGFAMPTRPCKVPWIVKGEGDRPWLRYDFQHISNKPEKKGGIKVQTTTVQWQNYKSSQDVLKLDNSIYRFSIKTFNYTVIVLL